MSVSPEVVAWIEEHPRDYQEGIFRGFVFAEHSPT